jgi:Putative amidoligase enzyme
MDMKSFQRNDFMKCVDNAMFEEEKRIENDIRISECQRRCFLPDPCLRLARAILEREGLVSNVEKEQLTFATEQRWNSRPADADFSAWLLKRDYSISSDHPGHEAIKYVPERCTEESSKNWKGRGVELVSRKLSAPGSDEDGFTHPSLDEVGKFVVALRGKDTDAFGCFPNESCGLHVHVGVAARRNPDKTVDFPLGVLQHLCYIVLQYETLISKLFPMSRRAQAHGKAKMIGSNLMGVRKTRHVCERYADPFVENRLLNIQERIFAPDMTIDLLCDIMSLEPPTTPKDGLAEETRYRFINFTNLSKTTRCPCCCEAPLTLEFRQHESTTDPTAIKHWIVFVLSLIRAAEHKAKQPTPQTPKSPTSNTNNQNPRTFAQRQGRKYLLVSHILDGQLDDLFALLNFNDDQRLYWLDRFRSFSPEAFADEQQQIHDPEYWSRSCPECYRLNKQAARDNDNELREQLAEIRTKQVQLIREASKRREVRAQVLAAEVEPGSELGAQIETVKKVGSNLRQAKKSRRKKGKMGRKQRV